MGQFTWTWDAPTGVFKSRAMSAKLYEEAVPETVFVDHASPVDGFGRKQGETVTLKRIYALTEPTTAVLTEGGLLH